MGCDLPNEVCKVVMKHPWVKGRVEKGRLRFVERREKEKEGWFCLGSLSGGGATSTRHACTGVGHCNQPLIPQSSPPQLTYPVFQMCQPPTSVLILCENVNMHVEMSVPELRLCKTNKGCCPDA